MSEEKDRCNKYLKCLDRTISKCIDLCGEKMIHNENRYHFEVECVEPCESDGFYICGDGQSSFKQCKKFIYEKN